MWCVHPLAPASALQGGIRGLWKGVVPNCQRAALVQVGDLTTYDFVKQGLRRAGVADGPVLHATCSVAAGLVAATLGAPADVIKTRVMNQVEVVVAACARGCMGVAHIAGVPVMRCTHH